MLPMVSTSLKHRANDACEIAFETSHRLDVFGLDFWLILVSFFGPFWGPKWGPFWDIFGDCLGQGVKSAKRTPTAAGALFSRVQGVRFGTHFATFSRTFSKVAFGRSLGKFFVNFRVQGAQGD